MCVPTPQGVSTKQYGAARSSNSKGPSGPEFTVHVNPTGLVASDSAALAVKIGADALERYCRQAP